MNNITHARKMMLIYRWAFLATLTTTLFWTTWYFVAGPVPLGIGNISRWWDVLFAPMCSTILIIVGEWINEYPDTPSDFCKIGLLTGMVVGIVLGLLTGMVIGLTMGLAFGLILGITIALLFVLGALIKKVIYSSKGLRMKCEDWLMARENKPDQSNNRN